MHTSMETLTREAMSATHDAGMQIDDPAKRADYLARVISHLLLQITKGAAYSVVRTTLDDNGVETLRVLHGQKCDEEKFAEQL